MPFKGLTMEMMKEIKHLVEKPWLTEEEKKLQKSFNDDKIKLRFHGRDCNVQLWYFANSGPYCITTFDKGDYRNAGKILQRRQKGIAEQKKMVAQYREMRAAEKNAKIVTAANELAKGFNKAARKPVSIIVP